MILPATLKDDPAEATAAAIRAHAVVMYDGGTAAEPRAVLDQLVTEEPLEIRVRGRAITITMRTPGHDADLAAGFLLGEGVVRTAGDLLDVRHCDRNEAGNVLDVRLAADCPVDVAALTRHVFASSSCGLCGAATIDAVRKRLPPLAAGGDPVVPARVIAALPGVMRARQRAFDQTGGLHAAAVFTAGGELVVLREDVGRHNAVDKVVGHCVRSGLFPLTGHVLVVSGRASFEIVQKALAARVAVVAAVSAPSALAARFADESGQTLIGFLRPPRFNVYAHPRRVDFTS